MTTNWLIYFFSYLLFVYFLITATEAPIPEFAQLCARLLGRYWEYIASTFSTLAVLGACIVYWVLMSNFLYNSVDYIIGKDIFLEQCRILLFESTVWKFKNLLEIQILRETAFWRFWQILEFLNMLFLTILWVHN